MFYSRYQAKMNAFPRREGGRGGRDAAFGASLREAASGADLGGNSKYFKNSHLGDLLALTLPRDEIRIR